MNIGRNIKKIRKEKKETLEKLSEKTGFSASYISQVENGKKEKPSREFLESIAYALDVSYTYLITGKKTLYDLSEADLKEQFSKLRFKLNKDNANRKSTVKSNFLDLIQRDLKDLDVHYFNNVYNFYELEKTEDDNLLFISVLLQMLRQHKTSGSKEAYDSITNEFNDFLKRYLNIK